MCPLLAVYSLLVCWKVGLVTFERKILHLNEHRDRFEFEILLKSAYVYMRGLWINSDVNQLRDRFPPSWYPDQYIYIELDSKSEQRFIISAWGRIHYDRKKGGRLSLGKYKRLRGHVLDVVTG